MPRAEGVLFCGGGTGGHVLPGLAVADRLRVGGERQVRWIGDPQRIEAKLVPAAGITLLPLGLSRPRPRDPRWLVHALRTAIACTRELVRRPPRVVVALGGYAALIPGLLAPLLRRPLVIMEQNAHAGRTNRLLARGAQAVVTQFPEAARALPRRRIHDLGNPVRTIAARPRGAAPRLRVLIMGGSLAAKSLNDLILAAAPQLARRADLHVIHLAGGEDAARCEAAWTAAGVVAVAAGDDVSTLSSATVEVHGFVAEMPALYDRIDVAVSRSGATTVAELAVAGIGALYVPLPWAAEDHQTANARAMARVGGAVVLPQATTSGAALATLLIELATLRERVVVMGQQALALARPDAAEDVATLVRTCAARRTDRGRSARSVARRAFQHRLLETRR